MSARSLTPSITVTIGQESRIYTAFITTAPTSLDSPATLTLYASSFSDVAGFAADPVTTRPDDCKRAARLVLVDLMELAWQRAKCHGHNHAFLPADPILVGANTMQHWLWQRLQAAAREVAA